MSVTHERVAGIDWASKDHAVCVVDETGEPVQRLTISHTKTGIDRVVAVFRRLGVTG